MDLVKHKRDMEHHQAHIIRVRNMTAHVDTSTPSSLGLKHLATRPKKQQLIDDRHQMIAKENRKLMERMTKIMSSNNIPEPPLKLGSLNEVERKHAVQRLNFENSLLLDRIKNTPAVIDRNRMDKDFERHRIVGGQLRRRQMKPIDSLFDETGQPITANIHKQPKTNSTFDAQSYITQLSAAYLPAGAEKIDSSIPIQTMSEFRQKVISVKKLASPAGVVRQQPGQPGAAELNTSGYVDGESARFMMKHTPLSV